MPKNTFSLEYSLPRWLPCYIYSAHKIGNILNSSAEANPDVECNIFIFYFLFTQHSSSAKFCLSPYAVFSVSTGEYVKCFQLKHVEKKDSQFMC